MYCCALTQASFRGILRRVHALAAIVTALTLPFGGLAFDSVQPAGGELLVSGRSGNGCVWVTVAPATLVAKGSHGSCVRPPRAAHAFVPAVNPNPHSPWESVRIEHGGARISYGPVVMRYRDASDARPMWAYGPGSFWLYDVDTERGPELLRFSSRTGQLKQRVMMPQLYRPVIAADQDGLYLMAAVNGGTDGSGPQALYRVTPEARGAAVVHRGGRAALWLVAHAHTVWVEIVSGTSNTTLWRFDGPKVHPTLLWRKANRHPCAGRRLRRRPPLGGRTCLGREILSAVHRRESQPHRPRHRPRNGDRDRRCHWLLQPAPRSTGPDLLKRRTLFPQWVTALPGPALGRQPPTRAERPVRASLIAFCGRRSYPRGMRRMLAVVVFLVGVAVAAGSASAGVPANPTWSPTGSQIAFSDGAFPNRFLEVMRASDGGGKRQLYSSNDACCVPILWAAEGRIVFVDDYRLFRISVAGGAKRRLFGNTEWFILSPNRQTIAFQDGCGCPGAPDAVGLMGVSGGKPIIIPKPKAATDSIDGFSPTAHSSFSRGSRPSIVGFRR